MRFKELEKKLKLSALDFVNKYILKRPKLPNVFMIETVLGCNLKCPECALGGDLVTRKKGIMSFENFKIIADKIRPYAKYVFMYIWGEALLNKDIFRMIEYVSEFADTSISTNGMLVNEQNAEKLIASGISDITISIDGTSQETYGQYRRGGDINQVFLALKYIAEANKRHGSKAKIVPQFIVFEHNQHEMAEFEKRCNELGLKAHFKAPYLRDDSKFKNSSMKEYIREPLKTKEEYENAILGCLDFTNVFTIDLEGNVVMCCYDANSDVKFGNIFNQSVYDIFYGKKHLDFLDSVKKKKICPEFCKKNCLTYKM